MNLMRLSPSVRSELRGDHRRDVAGGDHAADLVLLGGEQRADLLVGGFLGVGVGDGLDQRHRAVGLADGGLDRLDAQRRVGIDQQAGEMDDVALAAHRLDQLLGAEIGGVVDVGAEAEGDVGRVLGAAGERRRRNAGALELGDGRIDADRVAREDAEGGVALRGQALDQLGLQVELPFLRHLEVDRGDAEVLLRVGGGLFPGREIGVRSARNQGDLVVGRERAGGEARSRRSRNAKAAGNPGFISDFILFLPNGGIPPDAV